ncbi:MAG: hypothetical protein JSR44_16670 [Spirochaetes bacterium]|nr:hypothetical protein [Spirochaetota bacterium]
MNYPEKNLQAIYKILNPGGFLHFSMPAGNEDVWGLYSYYQNTQKAGLMLLNHVNYFEGESLPRFLKKIGFKEHRIFLYEAKDHLRGKGIILADTGDSRYTESPVAKKLIHELSGKITTGNFSHREKILSVWFNRPWFRPLRNFYCRRKHAPSTVMPVSSNTGHEIFGLFYKGAS